LKFFFLLWHGRIRAAVAVAEDHSHNANTSHRLSLIPIVLIPIADYHAADPAIAIEDNYHDDDTSIRGHSTRAPTKPPVDSLVEQIKSLRDDPSHISRVNFTALRHVTLAIPAKVAAFEKRTAQLYASTVFPFCSVM